MITPGEMGDTLIEISRILINKLRFRIAKKIILRESPQSVKCTEDCQNPMPR